MTGADDRGEAPAQYVALGSSFAAGIGLGRRVRGSPFVCQRSSNGYPQQLARLRDLSIVDRTCSGATTRHVLNGGQCCQASQLSAVRPETRLVTLTAGGNDVGYVGDLMLLAFRARGRVARALASRARRCLRPAADRDFEALARNLRAIVEDARRRAARAEIVVVAYPQILPPDGPCADLGDDQAALSLMRGVARELHATTRDAAMDTGALFVDMAALSAGHHIGSAEPWVNGADRHSGTPFHPTLPGAVATAREIAAALGWASPATPRA